MILPTNQPREYIYKLEPYESGDLIKILQDSYGFSSRILRNIKRYGILEINQQPAKMKSEVFGGEDIRIVLPKEEIDVSPSEGEISILYEDDEILVINKSMDLVSHQTKRHQTDTLANRVAYHAGKKGESYKIRFVNRLDMDTSGILLIAKNKFVHHFIQSQMPTDLVQKTYTVWVEDDLENPIPDEGTIELPIGRPDPESIKREILADGQQAVTHYKVLERFNGACKLEVQLETGRTHQIRVHLLAIGHPIIGDPLYNPSSIERFGLGRQALHASKLKFPLPKKGVMKIQAPIPEDLENLERRLRENIE